ncbi:NAD dependent epimerase/dehydratase family protein-like protein [Cucurbitaria berberidis CBS 394.84]|uniref:NAD dependent epimerase/dehydratase family protein-like protein n=1 Tax=Cucurbitaria berberidis CBS 394.84 TaxID=1168544 RepID=A0A9P4L7Z0_9PLEO|nr:NAD dependent epimerase/dehydratase family protein-like protein [Cucurbitaria berberidis CBS 394.84]KAF1845481.1 NAD dependent epimerase/dehydratase family protein-like protein [Cucurbitaria berberidis CBS 394.84]
MSNQQIVQTKGIYHGLPVYPSSLKGLTAIITGANGISGNYMLRVLAQDPERWKKIYCLSRRPPTMPGGLPKNAEHIALDFLKSPVEIADVLREKNVKAEYVFFYSYVQVKPKVGGGLWSDAEEMCRVNVSLLQNFCEALPLSDIKPKRIMLQTGAKNYGVHLGPSAIPQEESAPRVVLEPNFYYPQEDFLWSFCNKHTIDWNVCMPASILGAVPEAAMNLVFPLGCYASVQKHLGEKLEFPCDLKAWETNRCMSSSKMNGYMEEWAVLNDGAKNEKFNTMDGTTFTWGNFWPKFAAWYGVGYEQPSMDSNVYTSVASKYDPPPRGFGPPATYRFRFRLVDWAKQAKVQRAWEELNSKYDLTGGKLQDMDIDRIFGFTDGGLMGSPLDLTMNKARKMGWHGFVDSNDAIKEVLGEFADLKMIPPIGK